MDIEEMKDKAIMADMAEQGKLMEFAPSGEYSSDSVNRTIRSVNEVLKLFAAPPVGEIEGDVDGALPLDLVKAMNMINIALEDAKMSEYMFDMEELSNDRDLAMARGKLDAAGKDRAFKAFLAKPMRDEVEVEVEVDVEEQVPEGMHRMPDGRIMSDSEHEGEDEDLDKLMMSRMR